MPEIMKDGIDGAILSGILGGGSSLSEIVQPALIKDAKTRQALLSLHECLENIFMDNPEINANNRFDGIVERLFTFGNVKGFIGTGKAIADAIANFTQMQTDFTELMDAIKKNQSIEPNLKKQLYSTIFLLLKKIDQYSTSKTPGVSTAVAKIGIEKRIYDLSEDFAKIDGLESEAKMTEIKEIKESPVVAPASSVQQQENPNPNPASNYRDRNFSVVTYEEKVRGPTPVQIVKNDLSDLLLTLKKLLAKRVAIRDSRRKRNMGGLFPTSSTSKLEAANEVVLIKMAIQRIEEARDSFTPDLRAALYAVHKGIRKHSFESKSYKNFKSYIDKYQITATDQLGVRRKPSNE